MLLAAFEGAGDEEDEGGAGLETGGGAALGGAGDEDEEGGGGLEGG